MNHPIQVKTTPLFLILFALVRLALPQRMQATDLDSVLPGGNTADGFGVLTSLTTGGYNTANGWNSLHTTSTTGFNTAFGAATLFANIGIQNTAIGSDNTAVGVNALKNNTAGMENTANGFGALAHNTTGINNIALGYEAGLSVTTASNTICIGASGNNVTDSCYIGNIFGATSSNGTAVFVNSNGRLGTITSSARFKEDIKPMDKTSEALFALKPVCFRYKKEIDPVGTSQLGLVAEDVEKVNPDLIVRDKEGKPYSVRYEAVNAMLLNEFLKEHRKVQELESAVAKHEASAAKQDATIAKQQKQIEALTAGLQKVSAQLEASKPAPQVVNNQ